VSGGYLVSWFRQDRLPGPLVTTGSPTDARPGALGQPTTVVLFDSTLNYDALSGVQLAGGVFLDDSHCWSVEGRGFYVFRGENHFTAASNAAGSPIITRPILNVATETRASVLDAFPGVASGSATVDSRSELYGFEVNGRWHTSPMDRLHLDGLLGFRFLHLRESLSIMDQLTPLTTGALTFLGTAVNPPNSLADLDVFRTTNHFYGGQVGGRLTWDDEWYFVSMYGKVALGLTTERTQISGTSTLVTPAGNQLAEGGILALPSNIGVRNRTIFGIVPEWGATLGFNVTSYLRLTAGYSFLLWNRVSRPGDLIDRAVNPAQIPTSSTFGGPPDPARPEFRFNDSPFWVHMATVGVEVYF
jgi:hypothetical protein